MGALGLLLPRGCAGCDLPDHVLCDDCRALFGRTVVAPLAGTLTGRSYSCAVYDGCVRHAILAWKDHGESELDRPFRQLLAGLAWRSGLMDLCGGGLFVVPAPSSPRSLRRRGRRHLDPLARALAAMMRRHGIEARAYGALEAAHVHDRSVQTRGRAGRAARIGDGGIAVPARAVRLVDGTRVVLVDDIVTTGATLHHCVTALGTAGARVVGALTLAATPPPGPD